MLTYKCWSISRPVLCTALNHNRHSTREDYIENIKKNEIAIRVKLCDLKNNMDLSRIPNPTEKDLERKKRYEREYEELVDAYRLSPDSLAK